MQIVMAKAAGGLSPGVVEGARGTRMAAKVAAVPQRRVLRAKPGIQAASAAAAEEGSRGSTMVQSVTVASWPTLMDTLARGSVWRGEKGAGVVSQMVIEGRMEGDGKRARRVVLEMRRWRVKHVSVGGRAQPSRTTLEPLSGLEMEEPTDRGGKVTLGLDDAVWWWHLW
jgi:hypothetical protein